MSAFELNGGCLLWAVQGKMGHVFVPRINSDVDSGKATAIKDEC